jgi:hypothetical protein
MAILPIDDSELAGIRADFESRMVDTAHRIRNATQYDGEGGIEPVDENEAIIEIKCRLQWAQKPKRSRERELEGDRDVEQSQWTLLVPVGSDIKDGDRIILLSSDGQPRDEDYTVVGAWKEGTQRFQDAWLLKRVR